MAKRKQLITPVAPAKYTHLNKPDTKWKAEGEFSVSLVMDPDEPEVKALTKELDALAQAALEAGQEQFDEAKGKTLADWKKRGITEPTLNLPYEDEYDEEGEPTGNIVMRFKTGASFKDRKTGKQVDKIVPFIDGQGVMIPRAKRPLVYGGSELRVAFTTGNVFIPKDAAVFLGMYLNQVQIVSLQTGGGASAFGAVEGSDFSEADLEEYEGNASASGSKDNNDEADLDDDLEDDEIPF